MAIRPVLPSWRRQALNVVASISIAAVLFLCLPLFLYGFSNTFEAVWQILLAEINRRKNIRRVQVLEENLSTEDEEKGASINLISTASYHGSPGLEIMVIGIDGEHDEDMEMIQVVEEVFSDYLTKIHLEEPFGPLAVRLAHEYVYRKLEDKKDFEFKPRMQFDYDASIPQPLLDESRRYGLQMVCERATNILRQHGVLEISSTKSLRAICISQPHQCKKDIMFTNMIFRVALGSMNDIDFLWISDSDTWVFPDTLYRIFGCMATDPLIGGSSSALSVHNGHDSWIAEIGAAVYWTELAITRGQTGAVDCVDCQPGPCAAFRLIALEPILMSWYTQTCLGVRIVVNEDCHLTTNLLLHGWKVTFNTSALAATDTPATLLRWLMQQIRWHRATNIDRFQYPKVYAIHGSIFFLTAMRRFYRPLIFGICIIKYVLTGSMIESFSLVDCACRVVICIVYNHLVNKNTVNSTSHLAISQMGIVAAGVTRHVASRWAPELLVELMLASAGSTIIGLYFVLFW